MVLDEMDCNNVVSGPYDICRAWHGDTDIMFALSQQVARDIIILE
jgi:hypothetical protein